MNTAIRTPRAVLAFAALLSLSCSTGDPAGLLVPRRQDMNGGYAYRAFGANSALLLVGTVRITTGADGSLTGTWEIDWAPEADHSATVGPQVGTGSLAGNGTDGQVFIDLNPGWADNNVFLFAAASVGGDLSGEWQHSTFIGPVAGGRFEMQHLGP